MRTRGRGAGVLEAHTDLSMAGHSSASRWVETNLVLRARPEVLAVPAGSRERARDTPQEGAALKAPQPLVYSLLPSSCALPLLTSAQDRVSVSTRHRESPGTVPPPPTRAGSGQTPFCTPV